MKVTIVTPTYNIEKYLAETLDSFLAQTHTDWESIIVDDGSRDGTVKVAESYAAKDPRFKVLTQTNQGGAAARDRAFAHADPASQAVLFFDHDDRLRSNALELLTDALGKHPECVAAYGLAAYMNSAGEPHRPGKYETYLRGRRKLEGGSARKMSRDEPMTYESLLLNNWIPIGGILIRKSAKEKAGPFDADTKYAHDWEMWIRLSLQGPIAFVDEVVYDYRVHPNNMSSSGDLFYPAQVSVWEKYIKWKDLPIEKRRLALEAYRLVHRKELAIKKRKAFRRYLRFKPEAGREIKRVAEENLKRFSEEDLR